MLVCSASVHPGPLLATRFNSEAGALRAQPCKGAPVLMPRPWNVSSHRQEGRCGGRDGACVITPRTLAGEAVRGGQVAQQEMRSGQAR